MKTNDSSILVDGLTRLDSLKAPVDQVSYSLGRSPNKFSFATKSFKRNVTPGSRNIAEILKDRTLSPDYAADGDSEDAFFVADLGEIARQLNQWRELLPRVEPFYAVKCNPDPMVLQTLINMGTGFDCASKTEIQTVLGLGVDPSRIIYANPCKQSSHIRFASLKGIEHMTFDNADELRKIKSIHPDAKLVLRILADDSRSLCKLGLKFGAPLQAVPELLAEAKRLQLSIVGVSFHVGSGCFDASAFTDAVVNAKAVFDIGLEMGFDFELLDIGGGFPGNTADGLTFKEIAERLGPAIDEHFPPSVRVIAEPGRYFVSSAFTLAVNVVARRVDEAVDSDSADKSRNYMYYVNDGMYGSFNCITFDHAVVKPEILVRDGMFLYNEKVAAGEVLYKCSIWGPTCDSIDCITKTGFLPVLDIGDWLHFNNMGAYTMCAASQFNGFRKSSIIYTNTQE